MALRFSRFSAYFLLLAAPAAGAHGFAQRYDLPVPLGLYLGGAALAVALSFVVAAMFVRGHRTVRWYPRWNLLSRAPGRWLASPWLLEPLRAASVAFLAVVIVAGFIGQQNPYRNLAPTAVWVLWWVGMAYVSGLLGDLWAVVNPWGAAFRWMERLYVRLVPGSRFGLQVAWPRWLGCWPALVLFVWFVWSELIWPGSDSPARLARAVSCYSALTLAGMFVFGRHAWLRGGEAFSLAFGFLARFAPTEFRVSDPEVCKSCREDCYHGDGCVGCLECFESAARESREFNLRPWAVGLLARRPLNFSSTAFVLVMLSSVTFDGLLATPLWAAASKWMLYSEFLRPLIIALQNVTGHALAAIGTVALVTFLVVFQSLYWAFCALMRSVTPPAARARAGLADSAGLFVLSLVPIALAYHLAHYLSFLLIVGQYLIPLASDPFGFDWNLLGTHLYQVNIGVVNARFVWLTSVTAIVTGHIVAVWLAHVTALRTFRDNRAALLSQLPMLALMVCYTVLSLWILAQPVVETR